MKKKEALNRIVNAIERLTPRQPLVPNFSENHSFFWQASPYRLEVVKKPKMLNPEMLLGIDNVKNILINNTKQFANGFSANNALLWGARGMGKSSLVTSVHSLFITQDLKLIEIRREDLSSLDELIMLIENINFRFIVFCDDLSFGTDDTEYKSLKALLDGGLKSRPKNIIFYATSNRKHLMPRDMIDNEASTAISPAEAVEEKISLSDRFGLWLGFYKCTQTDFFEMVKLYCDMAQIEIEEQFLFSEALKWQQARGSRSGRVAWQFVTDLAGKKGANISDRLYP
jgi:predicted AAA+ superfamily ATPase